MTTRARVMLALVLAAAGCGSEQAGVDGGLDAASDASSGDAGCTTPAFECCSSCGDDTPAMSTCVDGQMTCPAGTKPQSSWVCPCYAFACSLPPPFYPCQICDGGTTKSVCDVDASRIECPAGSYPQGDLDAAAATCAWLDASASDN